MEILGPAAAVAFVALPVIVGLYILKIRGPEVRVAGLFLWPAHLADRQAKNPWRRLRPTWPLVLQLLIASALALALMRPGLVGAAGVASTTVVLLDSSPSMAATDIAPSRFGSAIDQARQMAENLGAGQQMAVVLLGRHASVLTPPTDDVEALRTALSGVELSGAPANLDEGLSVANALLADQSNASVVLFSDGHALQPDVAPRLAAPFTYVSVGTSGRNVALDALGRTPEGDVFLRVNNLGPSNEDRQIEFRADDRLVDVVPVQVAANSSKEVVWPQLPGGTSVLEARLVPGDNLALDDAAWMVTAAPSPRRVLVVTDDRGFLTRALGLRPELELTVMPPEEYRTGGTYDLSVFDGFIPDGPLPSPALVIAPPEGKGPVPAGPDIEPGELLPAAPREPLLQYVSLRDVHVQMASAVSLPPGWRTVIAAANGPLLVVSEGEPRLAQLNFDIHDSDLPLRPAFPILIQNLVAHLIPVGVDHQVVPLGQPVRLSVDPTAASVELVDPAGGSTEIGPPFLASAADLSLAGVYTVKEAGGQGESVSRFAAQLQDPEQSRISPGEPPLVRTVASAPGDDTLVPQEIWPWLAALAFVGLLLEWFMFLRG